MGVYGPREGAGLAAGAIDCAQQCTFSATLKNSTAVTPRTRKSTLVHRGYAYAQATVPSHGTGMPNHRWHRYLYTIFKDRMGPNAGQMRLSKHDWPWLASSSPRRFRSSTQRRPASALLLCWLRVPRLRWCICSREGGAPGRGALWRRASEARDEREREEREEKSERESARGVGGRGDRGGQCDRDHF